MWNRFWLVALVVFALPCAGTARGQSSHDRAEGETRPSVSYAVSYRKPGALDWIEFKAYPRSEDANKVARQIEERGYEVQVLSRFSLTRVPAPPATEALAASDTVTPQQAVKLHRYMAAQKDIAFAFPIDGCYARAHLMCQRLEKRGVKVYKAWTFANGDEKLHVRTDNHPKGYVEWKYHVAPIVRVQFSDERQRWYVIDPSLFSNPVTIGKWKDAQKKPDGVYEPFVTLTRQGQPPKDPAGVKMPGSGYWPGKDPNDVDQHARAVMELYKPYERRVPPASVFEQFKRLVNTPRRWDLLFREPFPEEESPWLSLAG